VSEEQVRQKMTADGWIDVQIARERRYLQPHAGAVCESTTRRFVS
jgi:hypothetical protein